MRTEQDRQRGRRGAGSMRELGPGRYEIRWSDRRGIPRSRTVHGTADDAAQALRIETAKRDTGQAIDAGTMRLSAYIGHAEPSPTGWLAAVRPALRPRSFTRYADICRLYIVPTLGPVRLDRLTPEHVTDAMAEWADAGASPASIAYRVRILRMILGRAMKARRVAYNAATLIDLPAFVPADIVPPDEAEVSAILRAVAGSDLELAYAIAIATGIRQGELLALRWRDIDLEAGLVTIRASRVYGLDQIGAPKTRAGRRVIPLPAWCIAILRRHELTPDRYLIQTRTGRPLDARNLLRRHHRLMAELGMPRYRWHDLRHYAATRLLSRGVPLAVIGRYLGHADYSTTVDTYGHLELGGTAEAMER